MTVSYLHGTYFLNFNLIFIRIVFIILNVRDNLHFILLMLVDIDFSYFTLICYLIIIVISLFTSTSIAGIVKFPPIRVERVPISIPAPIDKYVIFFFLIDYHIHLHLY